MTREKVAIVPVKSGLYLRERGPRMDLKYFLVLE